jgi:hypothetical protein
MTHANATADDPYLAAATAVMDAVALTPLRGLCRDGVLVTLDGLGVPAGVTMGWAMDTRDRIADAIRMTLRDAVPGTSDLVAAALRYRDAVRAIRDGYRVDGTDYAARIRDRDAALADVLRWADRHAAAAGEGGGRE